MKEIKIATSFIDKHIGGLLYAPWGACIVFYIFLAMVTQWPKKIFVENIKGVSFPHVLLIPILVYYCYYLVKYFVNKSMKTEEVPLLVISMKAIFNLILVLVAFQSMQIVISSPNVSLIQNSTLTLNMVYIGAFVSCYVIYIMKKYVIKQKAKL